MQKIIIFLLFFVHIFMWPARAQEPAVGHWRSNLSWAGAINAVQAGSKICWSTQSGIMFYDPGDNSVKIISKVNGLSDIGVVSMDYSADMGLVVVAYSNSNIDLIDENGGVTNIPDIKTKGIQGDKSIYDVTCAGGYAYLGTGLGIVVIDLKKYEIADTYFIGENASNLKVNDISVYNDTIYAATQTGIYAAYLRDPLINDFHSWKLQTGFGSKPYSKLCVVKGGFLAAQLHTDGKKKDTLFIKKNNAIAVFDTSFIINSIHAYNNEVMVVSYKQIIAYDLNLQKLDKVTGYNWLEVPVDAIKTTSGQYAVADETFGMFLYNKQEKRSNRLTPSGPQYPPAFDMQTSQNVLWVAGGGHNIGWGPTNNIKGVYKYVFNEDWNSYSQLTGPKFDSIWDINAIAIDPTDPNHVYAGSFKGLLEIKNGQGIKIYTDKNSPLTPHIQTADLVVVSGASFDNLGNLWVLNAFCDQPLLMLSKKGEWTRFDVKSKAGAMPNAGNSIPTQMIHTSWGHKWIVFNTEQMIVYDDNGTPENQNDDQAKLLTITMNDNGSMVNSTVTGVAEDLDGNIWISTAKGVGIFFGAASIFETNNTQPTQIIVEQDGYAGYLLNTEVCKNILIDGANRKWIGTERNGVFLISGDGNKQIQHFTAENSPILNNTVRCMALNNATGEVFFGFDQGIVSYKSTATKGNEDFSGIYAYPNPVPHAYQGSIAINGLFGFVNVKITDLAGHLVYETKAQGGQAIWNGTTLHGERVQTGVYMVFCTNTDGTATKVTKILFIN